MKIFGIFLYVITWASLGVGVFAHIDYYGKVYEISMIRHLT